MLGTLTTILNTNKTLAKEFLCVLKKIVFSATSFLLLGHAERDAKEGAELESFALKLADMLIQKGNPEERRLKMAMCLFQFPSIRLFWQGVKEEAVTIMCGSTGLLWKRILGAFWKGTKAFITRMVSEVITDLRIWSFGLGINLLGNAHQTCFRKMHV